MLIYIKEIKKYPKEIIYMKLEDFHKTNILREWLKQLKLLVRRGTLTLIFIFFSCLGNSECIAQDNTKMQLSQGGLRKFGQMIFPFYNRKKINFVMYIL